jgi:alpha-methylacyl-CoA racemase
MTGWGQTGPLATAAGHDLDYIAVAGALHDLGQDPARPHFPGNLLGDFGGGSTYLVIGVLAALLESRVSGHGQVVDAAIVDGTAHLNAMGAMLLATGMGGGGRARGLIDGGAPFYDLYETSDGRHLAVGALEPQFYAELLERLGLTGQVPDRGDPTAHALLREAIAARIAERTQAEWGAVFEGSDACVAPVLTLHEAASHPHLRERETFTEVDGHLQPNPAPRFSRTRPRLTTPPDPPGAHTREALEAWGAENVDALLASGAAVQA